MEKNFEIEIEEAQSAEQEILALPVNFLTFGEIDRDDVKVYIKEDVYKALEKLSASDTEKELGSILLGDYSVELGKTHVVISRHIEAKYTDASASTLTFTHETWEYIHSEQEKRWPDLKIVGWQHTHPNYGIFLSNYDMFIQENFFDLPFQIAYVIDPIQNLRGFFQWKNGKVEKLRGYYIYDEPGKPIKIPQMQVKKENGGSSKPHKLILLFLCMLCIATICLTFAVRSLSERYRQQLVTQESILAELESQKQELADQRTVIHAQSDTISEQQEHMENYVSELQDQEKLLQEIRGSMEETMFTEEKGAFVTHTVTEGETLYRICVEHGLDYEKDLPQIMELNHIPDADRIHVGQTILLPIAESAE